MPFASPSLGFQEIISHRRVFQERLFKIYLVVRVGFDARCSRIDQLALDAEMLTFFLQMHAEVCAMHVLLILVEGWRCVIKHENGRSIPGDQRVGGIFVDQGQRFLALGQKNLEARKFFYRIGFDAEGLVPLLEFGNPVSDLRRIKGVCGCCTATQKGRVDSRATKSRLFGLARSL